MLDSTLTGKMISEARKRQGLTQDQVAAKLYVTKQAVSNWERGINLPEEHLRESLEKLLHCNFRQNRMMDNHKTLTMRPLDEICTTDEMIAVINTIVNHIEIDDYERVIRKMLHKTLALVIGEVVYNINRGRGTFDEDNPIAWEIVAGDLENLFDYATIMTPSEEEYPFNSAAPFSQKIEWVAFNIAGQLFEDFDENGYKDGFAKQIGRYGMKCGYDLIKLLPDNDNSVITVYKSSLMDMITLLSTL